MFTITRSRRPWACVLAIGLLTASTIEIQAADGRASRQWKGKRHTPAAEAAAKAERDKGKPLPQVHLAVVSLSKQRITLYGAGGFRTQGAVSTGMRGFPTPAGVFSVLQKNRYHRSNIYSGAPMPFMQRITWSGVALHAGVLPGYPASHGCIRLTHTFAAQLWGMTKVGARVVVTPEDIAAVEIAHAGLPQPSLRPAQAPRDAVEPVKPPVVTIATEPSPPPTSGNAGPELLDPLERAKIERARLIEEAPARAKAARRAHEQSTAAAAQANEAVAGRQRAEDQLATARAKLAAATKAVEGARTPEAAERAKAALTAAQAKLEDATNIAASAAELEVTKTQAAFAAAASARDAENASETAAARLRASSRFSEPISVFVSRKAGRVYIRQAWAPIHEAPVTFKNPDMVLGTHVYVAMEGEDDGRNLRWLSVSMAASPPAKAGHARGRHAGRNEIAPATGVPEARETAASVLSSFELSPETKAIIADRLWPGASLVVSDHAASQETGKYTDFIVQTR